MRIKKKEEFRYIKRTLSWRIFTGELPPGTKLPPLRTLAEEMNTDPASLRMALKHLEAMNVVDVKRSDGTYIKDYMQHAGLDFLTTLLLDKRNQKEIVDEYFVDEAWDFWALLLPEVLRLALRNINPRDIKAIIEILDEAMKSIGDSERMVALEMKSQDWLVGVAGNSIVTLLFNMIRLLRENMVRFLFTNLNDEEIRAFTLYKKDYVRKLINASPEDLEKSPGLFRAELQRQQQVLRNKLFK